MPVEQYSSGPTKKLYTAEYVESLKDKRDEALKILRRWMELPLDSFNNNAGLIKEVIKLLSWPE